MKKRKSAGDRIVDVLEGIKVVLIILAVLWFLWVGLSGAGCGYCM